MNFQIFHEENFKSITMFIRILIVITIILASIFLPYYAGKLVTMWLDLDPKCPTIMIYINGGLGLAFVYLVAFIIGYIVIKIKELIDWIKYGSDY